MAISNRVAKHGKHDPEPTFLLGPMGVILSIIFLPIGIFVLIIATIVYLADWMCYNFNLPRPLCWLMALILGPLFLPFVLLSFLYEATTGDDTYSVRRSGASVKSKEEKVLSSASSKKSSPKRKTKASPKK